MMLSACGWRIERTLMVSDVKFWQMIGRGTRLCEDLFGPGKNKSHFLIFDHWKNFEYFDQQYQPAEPKQAKSLPQIVFENRIKLAETALHQANPQAFDLAIDLIAKDIADLPGNTIAIKEKWKEIKSVSHPETLRQFEALTKAMLLNEIAPLMQWRNIGGNEAAHKFDLLVCRLQIEHLKRSSSFDDLKVDLQGQLDELRMNLSQVKAVAPLVVETRTADFWTGVTVEKLENMRGKLRGVMQYRQGAGGGGRLPPKVIDIKEDPTLIERKKHAVKLEGLQLAAYRNRVEKVLRDLFENNDTLKRIKSGQPVSKTDLEALTSLVLTQDPMLNLNDLVDYYPDCAGHLDLAIRSIIGLLRQPLRNVRWTD
jgi:type I restriction enzyme R subunit